jgi:hypothetical protein
MRKKSLQDWRVRRHGRDLSPPWPKEMTVRLASIAQREKEGRHCGTEWTGIANHRESSGLTWKAHDFWLREYCKPSRLKSG